jgi:hypothetical protein
MDPNETLKQIRHFAELVKKGENPRGSERQVRWLFEDLDRWLTNGGPLPDDWSRSV